MRPGPKPKPRTAAHIQRLPALRSHNTSCVKAVSPSRAMAPRPAVPLSFWPSSRSGSSGGISTSRAMAPRPAMPATFWPINRDGGSVGGGVIRSSKLARRIRQFGRKRWSRALTHTISRTASAAHYLSGAVTAHMTLQHSIDLLSSPRITFATAQDNNLLTDKVVHSAVGSGMQQTNSTGPNAIVECASKAHSWVGKQLAKVVPDPFRQLVEAWRQRKQMRQLVTRHHSRLSLHWPSAGWPTFCASNATVADRGRSPSCL